MITLMIVGATPYVFLGSTFGHLVYRHNKKRCHSCTSEYDCYRDHWFAAVVGGVFWPVALTIMAGSVTSDFIALSDERMVKKVNRESKKHEHKMAEIDAERRLVREQKEKTLADVQFLVANGIKAEVPGLYDEGV